MGHVICELCFNGAILQRNYRKMTISWNCTFFELYKEIIGKRPNFGHFPIISLYYSMVKKFWSHKITVLYPNLCCN